MQQDKKNDLLQKAQGHVSSVSDHMFEHSAFIETSIRDLREKLRKGGLEDPEVLITILMHRIESRKQLEYSYKTPYFIRCDVLFDDEEEKKILYFGRFPFTKDSIYSWIAPAASIRFEALGKFTYMVPNGEERKGELLRKDQFMIVDRRIIFFSSETNEYQRELIYQEYFSERKTGFVLPEIVEQMERAQDKIIRSHHVGSFLISGAAGSGKTTLALHRVAYLAQSPETAELFQPQTIIVFVQDASTKQYFSGLLPELGIYRVKIVTFDEWAMHILNLKDVKFVGRVRENESESDEYEESKNKAVKNFSEANDSSDVFSVLERVYGELFTNAQLDVLRKQKKEKVLDRFDITILLKNELLKSDTLFETVEKYVKQKTSGKYVKKIVRQPVQYSLIVLDEAENYLSEQITVIKRCIDPRTNALVYVGDLVQQTLLWTIKNWDDAQEIFPDDRKVVLRKVYRNTRQILEYINSIGYSSEVPRNLREGKAVREKIVRNKSEEEGAVLGIIEEEKKGKTLGILGKTEGYIRGYKNAFSTKENVHVMTINEAQGVEFDTVVLVGINEDLYATRSLSERIVKERKRVNKDLLYVALTRAMNKLYVLGDTSLKELRSRLAD